MTTIDLKQLEINVNMYALQPDFLSLELHYIIASSDKEFRFVEWHEEPKEGEFKFFCFLTDNQLHIPAGDVLLPESYVLTDEAVFPLIANTDDFMSAVDNVSKENTVKGIRRFTTDNLEVIRQNLENKYGFAELHQVKSGQGSHLILLTDSVEFSISATMVYCRSKTPVNAIHYRHVKEDLNEETNGSIS